MATEKEKIPEKEELVMIMIPYVEGQDPVQYVGVNGVSYQIKKGVTVQVPKKVAEVISNSNLQMMEALETQKKYRNQKIADL